MHSAALCTHSALTLIPGIYTDITVYENETGFTNDLW